MLTSTFLAAACRFASANSFSSCCRIASTASRNLLSFAFLSLLFSFAANRSSFAVGPITEDIIATQQGVADRFFKLGLIPRAIAVRDIVWRNTQT